MTKRQSLHRHTVRLRLQCSRSGKAAMRHWRCDVFVGVCAMWAFRRRRIQRQKRVWANLTDSRREKQSPPSCRCEAFWHVWRIEDHTRCTDCDATERTKEESERTKKCLKSEEDIYNIKRERNWNKRREENQPAKMYKKSDDKEQRTLTNEEKR